jgi:glycerol-3-phosphate dehydrogenase
MQRRLDVLKDGLFDLFIIGGGITGAGVALDAALRGLRVALIDKGDFASGTSSVSSKLVHGGLRYLEYGAFHLVYEALHERGLLLRNAPHLVRPLRFILPLYRRARIAPWKWRLGLTLYDILAGAGNIARSRPVRLDCLRHEFPGLRPERLLGAAEFYDAQMDDARLCIEVLQTAAAQGAILANYVEAVAFEGAGSTELRQLRVIDRVAGTEWTVRARQVLNAAGPWVDAVCRLAGEKTGPLLQPTKGVHIIAPDRGLNAAFLLLHPADGRIVFVIPWMGKTLIGATDTFTPEGPDALRVEPDEIQYLLEAYNGHFAPPLEPDQVLGSFVGLRPLIRARRGQPSSLSREFRLFESPSGLLSAAGGKYTTYRRMAEEITDVVVARLGRRRSCRTRDSLLDGTPRQAWGEFAEKTELTLREQHGLSASSARHLIDRYGRRALDVAGYLKAHPDGSQPLFPGEPDLRVELPYQRDHEMALFPADHFLRRMRLGMYRPEVLAQEAPLA